MLNAFIILAMIALIMIVVYKQHSLAYQLVLPLAFLCLLTFFGLKWYHKKHTMSEEQFETTL